MTGGAEPLGLSLTTSADMAETEAAVRDCLAAAGFGILTEIDIQATLRAKLDVEIAPHRILGACNPSLAHRALTADPSVGLLLPCNVVLRRSGEGRTQVEVANPLALLTAVDTADVRAVAQEARARLDGALAALAEQLPDAVAG